MKTLKILSFLFIVAFLISSCENETKFKDFQPIGSKQLTKFPDKLQGIYLNIDDSSMVEISENAVKVISTNDGEFLKNGEKIINLGSNQFLTKWKKYYFLNIKNDGGNWDIFQLEKRRNELTISVVKDELVLKKIATNITKDGNKSVIDFNKKQFTNFVKSKGFTQHMILLKKQ